MGDKIRLAALVPLLMMLSACLFTPGKFESSLDIRADRSFTFAYKGEVIASDMDKGGMPDFGPANDSGGDQAEPTESTYHSIALMVPVARKVDAEVDEAKQDFGPKADSEDIVSKLTAVANALSKEKGFKSARYTGNHRIEVDYAISGTLDHSFIFPFNVDAQMVFPFIAIELRGDDKVRVKAPGFANESNEMGSGAMGGMGSSSDEASKALDGMFTLTTDAEIVSQNQEDGAQAVPNGKKIMWKVGPLTTTAPMAVLRLNP